MAGSDSRRSTSNSPGKMISEAEKASAQTGGSKGSLRLFQFFGTTVYVHWSWFLVAYFQIQDRAHEYTWFGWNVLEYVSTFLIVLLHEFGHVFACKSVGGVANKVVLWPLGGVALVSTPRRAGAEIWTTAAGPLVNVLLPLLFGLHLWSLPELGPNQIAIMSDAAVFWEQMLTINIVMLVFNLLPVFPMDGGRLFRGLLWLLIGERKSLMIAALVGLLAALFAFVFALTNHMFYFVAMAVFIMLNAIGSLNYARQLASLENAERHDELACPNCGESPPRGAFWRCVKCHGRFDLFGAPEVCMAGRTHETSVACPVCSAAFGPQQWVRTTG